MKTFYSKRWDNSCIVIDSEFHGIGVMLENHGEQYIINEQKWSFEIRLIYLKFWIVWHRKTSYLKSI